MQTTHWLDFHDLQINNFLIDNGPPAGVCVRLDRGAQSLSLYIAPLAIYARHIYGKIDPKGVQKRCICKIIMHLSLGGSIQNKKDKPPKFAKIL